MILECSCVCFSYFYFKTTYTKFKHIYCAYEGHRLNTCKFDHPPGMECLGDTWEISIVRVFSWKVQCKCVPLDTFHPKQYLVVLELLVNMLMSNMWPCSCKIN